jgi:hypothetical protein
LIPMVREMERLRERVQMNGHFKDVIPPKVWGGDVRSLRFETWDMRPLASAELPLITSCWQQKSW